jgi:hypothetical protein
MSTARKGNEAPIPISTNTTLTKVPTDEYMEWVSNKSGCAMWDIGAPMTITIASSTTVLTPQTPALSCPTSAESPMARMWPEWAPFYHVDHKPTLKK